MVVALLPMVLSATSATAAPGALDTSFGTGGKVTTDFASGASGADVASSVAVEPDVKIVMAGGSSTAGNAVADFAWARYNTDGSAAEGAVRIRHRPISGRPWTCHWPERLSGCRHPNGERLPAGGLGRRGVRVGRRPLPRIHRESRVGLTGRGHRRHSRWRRVPDGRRRRRGVLLRQRSLPRPLRYRRPPRPAEPSASPPTQAMPATGSPPPVDPSAPI